MALFQTRDGRMVRLLREGTDFDLWRIFSRGLIKPYEGLRHKNGNAFTGYEQDDIVPVMATPREDECLSSICMSLGISRSELLIGQEQPIIEAMREYKGW